MPHHFWKKGAPPPNEWYCVVCGAAVEVPNYDRIDCTDKRRAPMGYGCQREFHLNEFHRANAERCAVDFKPQHDLQALVVCVVEEVGELAQAVLGYTGEKERKVKLGKEDVLDAVADAITYLSLVAAKVGCSDLEGLLGETFNMVSDRCGSRIKHGTPTREIGEGSFIVEERARR